MAKLAGMGKHVMVIVDRGNACEIGADTHTHAQRAQDRVYPACYVVTSTTDLHFMTGKRALGTTTGPFSLGCCKLRASLGH